MQRLEDFTTTDPVSADVKQDLLDKKAVHVASGVDDHQAAQNAIQDYHKEAFADLNAVKTGIGHPPDAYTPHDPTPQVAQINQKYDSLHNDLLNKYNPTTGGDQPIPKPDYNNPQSRLNFAKQFTSKYNLPNRGDTPLRMDETMDEATDSAKNLSIKAAKPLGIDPALLYSSAMEEGMSGLFKDKNGESDFSGNKDFPTGGFHSFGIDDFTDKVPGLIKKGYLPADFPKQFVKHVQINENGRPVNSADFKNPDAALIATAALHKDFQDQTEDYAKQLGVTLTPKQRDFFTLVAYNGGGNMKKMLSEYKQKGFLTDDKIDKDPTGHWTTITKHVAPRLQMRDALKKESKPEDWQ